MVLWEITVATAYFLGLKRTYRLALKLQRRAIGRKHPKIRQFLHKRTHSAFAVALSVHKKIQERDLEMGRSVGNWILRWLDCMKPSAEIRPHPFSRLPTHCCLTRSSDQAPLPPSSRITYYYYYNSSRRLFVHPWSIRRKSFPTITMMLQPANPFGMSTQYRTFCNFTHRGSKGIFRNDILQWMLQD